MKMKAEYRVMPQSLGQCLWDNPQAKKCQRLTENDQKLEGAMEQILPHKPKKKPTLLTPRAQASSPQNCETNTFLLLTPCSLWYSVNTAQEVNILVLLQKAEMIAKHMPSPKASAHIPLAKGHHTTKSDVNGLNDNSPIRRVLLGRGPPREVQGRLGTIAQTTAIIARDR